MLYHIYNRDVCSSRPLDSIEAGSADEAVRLYKRWLPYATSARFVAKYSVH